MTIERITVSINKTEDEDGQLSYVPWLCSSGGNRIGRTNCRLSTVVVILARIDHYNRQRRRREGRHQRHFYASGRIQQHYCRIQGL